MIQSRSRRIAAFREGLRALGYDERKSIVIDYRGAEGRFDQLPQLAELVADKVSVIVTTAPHAIQAARHADDNDSRRYFDHYPVAQGFVASLARPEGNITGVAFQGPELAIASIASPAGVSLRARAK